YQRTAAEACLNHQHAAAQATDNPVPPREMGGPGLCAGRVFRDNKTLINNALSQLAMLRRIQPVKAAAHHGNGLKTDIQGAGVGGSVNPQGKATGDQKPPPAEFGGKLPGVFQASPGGIATTDNAKLVFVQQVGITPT